MRLTLQQLEAHLWGAANILRGKTAGQDYQNFKGGICPDRVLPAWPSSRNDGEKVAANGLLPRIDILGSYGTNALSGKSRPTSFGSNIVVRRAPIPGAQCTFLSVDVGYICRTPPAGPSPFAGPARDAYGGLGEFESYAVGLRVEVPFPNAEAEGRYTISRIARDQAELSHRELLSRVTLEVEQSVSDVLSSRQRIDTSRVARELAEENLRNQEKRHEVGMSTTKDLLDFQSRLTSARAAEVRAKTDYATAVARWRRAQGRLLAHYQIVIAHGGERSAPWFTRF